MKHSLYLLLVASPAVLLGGCGAAVDDPANPPLLGNWTIETKLDSVSVNNMNFSRGAVVNQPDGNDLIEKVETKVENRCVEPALNEEGDLLEAVGDALDDCTMTSNDVTGNSRRAVLACTMNGDPVEAVVNATLEAESGTATIRATVTGKPKASGGRDRMSITLNQTMTRTGDCS